MQSRQLLLDLLDERQPPPGYRWKLDMDENLLALRIQEKERNPVLMFVVEQWKTIRELKAPTYAAMFEILKTWPEFLEYEATSKAGSEVRVTRLRFGKVAP